METNFNRPMSILDISIAKILPNPDNPAGSVDPEDAQAMAGSLKEEGQKTEIRVRLLTEAEKAQHGHYEYLLIGGHVRLEGAKLAGLPTLRAIVLEGVNPDQEFLDAALDNRWRDMGWWRWDLVIERLLKPSQGKGQAKVAAQLGFSTAKVSKAWKITQAMTPTARDWVIENLSPRNIKNKGFLITESILLALADLTDPHQVERALRRVLDDHLPEEKVKSLIAWIKAGNELEAFGANPRPVAPTPTQQRAEGMPNLPPSSQAAGQDFSSQASPSLGKGLKLALPLISRKLSRFSRLFQWVGGLSKGWAYGLGALVILWAASSFLSSHPRLWVPLATRLMGWNQINQNAPRTVTRSSQSVGGPPSKPISLTSPEEVEKQVREVMPDIDLHAPQRSRSSEDSGKENNGGGSELSPSKGSNPQVTTAQNKPASQATTTVTPGAKKGDDLGKAIEGGVKDLNHAVTTTQQGVDAVDQAKKLFGL